MKALLPRPQLHPAAHGLRVFTTVEPAQAWCSTLLWPVAGDGGRRRAGDGPEDRDPPQVCTSLDEQGAPRPTLSHRRLTSEHPRRGTSRYPRCGLRGCHASNRCSAYPADHPRSPELSGRNPGLQPRRRLWPRLQPHHRTPCRWRQPLHHL